MADLTKLQNSLLKARKVMGAVESGNIKPTTQNRTMEQQIAPEQMLSQPPIPQQPNMSPVQESAPTQNINMNPKASLTKDRIMESKLPDAIKKAMINSPIPTMDYNNATNKLSPEFIEEVSKKMKSNDYSVDGMRATSNSTIDIPPPSTTIPISNTVPNTSVTNTRPTVAASDMKTIIKETIKESLEEIVENKVRNILEETNINENLSLRVGNKIFFGKINKVKSVKK